MALVERGRNQRDDDHGGDSEGDRDRLAVDVVVRASRHVEAGDAGQTRDDEIDVVLDLTNFDQPEPETLRPLFAAPLPGSQ